MSSSTPPAGPPSSPRRPSDAPLGASDAPLRPSDAPLGASDAPSDGPPSAPVSDPDADSSADMLRALLRKAPPPPPPRADMLSGVQERLRVRSRGKFYADGWSTRDEEPRSTYLVTALFMLVVAVALYLALSPGAAGVLP
jgi:hypothetical protein